MTDIVETPPVAVVPNFPPVGSPTFNNDAYTFGAAMPGVAQTLHDTAEAARTNSLAAQGQAQNALQAAANAASVQQSVLSAANFKGLWRDLTGSLAKPASVKHSEKFWLLLRDVADVENEEPGVSDAWTSLQATTITQEVSASTVMQPGVHYVVVAAGVTLSVPEIAQAGDSISAADASGSGFVVNWRGYTVKGVVPSVPFNVPVRGRFEVIYSGSTYA